MKISHDELDAIRELINIGVGRAAGALNDMVGQSVQLNVPFVSQVAVEDIGQLIGDEQGSPMACVRLHFEGGLRGAADLLFPAESGSKLVALLTGEDPLATDRDNLRAATLTEVGNILLNGLMGSITNIIGEHLEYGLPVYAELTPEKIGDSLKSMPDAAVLLARAQFFIGQASFEVAGERIDGEITLLLGVDSLEHLIHRVRHLGEEIPT